MHAESINCGSNLLVWCINMGNKVKWWVVWNFAQFFHFQCCDLVIYVWTTQYNYSPFFLLWNNEYMAHSLNMNMILVFLKLCIINLSFKFKLLLRNHFCFFLTYIYILSFCFIWELLIHRVGCCSRYVEDLCRL